NLSTLRLGATDFASAWSFPFGTTIAPGGYLFVWLDGTRPGSSTAVANLNAGFGISPLSGQLFVWNANGQVLSQIRWGGQVKDKSIGLSGGTWQLLASPTRAAANAAPATLGSVTNVRINEWSTAAVADWFELFSLDAN